MNVIKNTSNLIGSSVFVVLVSHRHPSADKTWTSQGERKSFNIKKNFQLVPFTQQLYKLHVWLNYDVCQFDQLFTSANARCGKWTGLTFRN